MEKQRATASEGRQRTERGKARKQTFCVKQKKKKMLAFRGGGWCDASRLKTPATVLEARVASYRPLACLSPTRPISRSRCMFSVMLPSRYRPMSKYGQATRLVFQKLLFFKNLKVPRSFWEILEIRRDSWRQTDLPSGDYQIIEFICFPARGVWNISVTFLWRTRQAL